jgi:hypothetical protein
MAGIGFFDLIGGALAILGIFAAFMLWAIFPLMPFIILGAIYALIRYGMPALGRGAVALEHAVIATVRSTLRPVAVWALRDAEPAVARYGAARGRR